jgi:hypothetical protein
VFIILLVPRRNWEIIYDMDVKEIGSECADCIHVALVNMVMNLEVSYKARNFLTS